MQESTSIYTFCRDLHDSYILQGYARIDVESRGDEEGRRIYTDVVGPSERTLAETGTRGFEVNGAGGQSSITPGEIIEALDYSLLFKS